MRLYKKLVYESKNGVECKEETKRIAEENNCDYIIEVDVNYYDGYILKSE